MIWLFWSAAFFLLYTFAGYPALVWFISRWRNRPHLRAQIAPQVSIIIPVHNGAHLIADKIRNTLALNYPQDKMEIIVACDGSDDRTAEIVLSFSDRGVRLVEIPSRRGKHYAQMVARDASKGEILVFTDAAVALESDALEKIVSNFADPLVGSVSSQDRVEASGQRGIGESAYVRLEMWLRRLESSVWSLVGLSGSFFAARREVCEQWYPEQSSDFFVALNTVGRGMRAVVDPESLGHMGVVPKATAEFYRKVRTIVHGLDVLFTNARLLNPLRYGFFAWQFTSHKLFRWLLPFAFIVLLISNMFLWNSGLLYRLILSLQVAVYFAGLLGLAFAQSTRLPVIKLASFFLVANLATLLAWLKFCAGERFVIWEPSARN